MRIHSRTIALSLALAFSVSIAGRAQELPPDAQQELERRLAAQELERQRMIQELEQQRALMEQELQQRMAQQQLERERMLQEMEQQRAAMEQELQQRMAQQQLERERVLQELEQRRAAMEQDFRERQLGQGALRAQDQDDWETRVFQVQHVLPGFIHEALDLFPADVDSVNQLQVLSVRTSPEIMTAIEDVIRRLDVAPVSPPQRSVEMTAHILKASAGPGTGTLPENLRPVIQQLQNVFSYGGYELIDTVLMRGAATGSNNIQGSGTISMTVPTSRQPTFYSFAVVPDIYSANDGSLRVQLDRLAFNFRIPVSNEEGGVQYVNNGINTELAVSPDQQVILGKTAVGEDALILVLNARILD